MVDWNGLNGVEGLVATGVWGGTIEGRCVVKASGGSRVMIDYLAALRPMPAIFQADLLN